MGQKFKGHKYCPFTLYYIHCIPHCVPLDCQMVGGGEAKYWFFLAKSTITTGTHRSEKHNLHVTGEWDGVREWGGRDEGLDGGMEGRDVVGGPRRWRRQLHSAWRGGTGDCYLEESIVFNSLTFFHKHICT